MTAILRRRHAGAPSADDESILAQLADRLGRVDAELDRRAARAVLRATAPHLHVVRGRTVRAGLGPADVMGTRRSIARPARARLDLLAGAAGAVLLAFVLGRSASDTPPAAGSAGMSAGASAGASAGDVGASASAAASGSSRPVPATPPLAVPSGPPGGSSVDADLEGLRSAMGVVNWPCAIAVRVAGDPIAPGLVAKLEAMPLTDGFVPGGLDPLWSGTDPDAAAHAFKGRRLATAPSGGIWILRQSAAGGELLELRVQRTPGGSLLWRGGDVAWPIPCERVATDPKHLLADHAGSDWPSGQVIDIQAIRLADPPARAGGPS